MNLESEEERKDFSRKSTYTSEEKEFIMQELNLRRKQAEETRHVEDRYSAYAGKDKERILRQINDNRLEKQLYKEIKARRLCHKKLYIFDMKFYHKFLHMEREYFIERKDLVLLANRPRIITLYYRTFGEIKKRDFLIKVEVYSDKIFISNDMLRVYFKGYTLEND